MITLTDDRLATCLPFILKEEGGNDDDPHDPGGRTSRGIIQREYSAWRKTHGEPIRDVWEASDQEVADIYNAQYWQPWCPKMPVGVDLCYFDMAVNSGPVRAAKLLQQSLGVQIDGHIGAVTLGALSDSDAAHLIASYSDHRRAFYRSLRTFKYFGRGWMNRVATIEKAALKMVI